MAMSKPTLKTPSYTRQRLRIEFINAHCKDQDKPITELKRCIGLQHAIVERKGHWEIFFKENVNKNMSPRSVALSAGKVKHNTHIALPTALFDLRNYQFLQDKYISLKNVRWTKPIKSYHSIYKCTVIPTNGKEEPLPAHYVAIPPNDEIKAPIQATDDVNTHDESCLNQDFSSMILDRGASAEYSSEENRLRLPGLVTSMTTLNNGLTAANSQSRILTAQRQDNEQNKQARLSCHARYPDYIELYARLETFKHFSGKVNWPHDISIQNTTLLAKHGFFFSGRADLCRCYLCGLGLKDWSINDDVLFVHLKYSPNCKHLTETVDSSLLSVYRRNIQQTTDGNIHALTEPGAANSIKHPEYQGYTVRLASFKSWPRELSQTPGMLAEAGFFHTGMRDIVRCYACDGGLQQWDAGDQPWIEHARWFPFCEHVIREKGEEYIRLVQAAAETPADEEITEQEVPSDSPFPIYSPAATSVIGLGYSKSAVLMAIDECKANNLKLTADNLTNVLLDKEEKGEVLPTDSPRPESPKMPNFNEATKDGLQEENEYLKRRLLCIFCQQRECNILFLPCGHLKMCVDCSDKVMECPICSKTIHQKVKTFMS